MASTRIVNTPSQAIPTYGVVHAQLTVSSTSIPLMSAALNANTTHVLVQFNGANVRVTFDGNAATSTKGFVYVDGSTAYFSARMAAAAKVIRDDSTDAVAEIQELAYL